MRCAKGVAGVVDVVGADAVVVAAVVFVVVVDTFLGSNANT